MTPPYFLVVGLGNPGEKYEKTRHNTGFRVIDALESNKTIHDKIMLLVKPQTYMNESGITVQRLLDFYHLDPSHLLLVHDDVDLPLGTIRLQKGRGAAGHKGVESVIERLKTNEFLRLRCGIGRPEHGDVEQFVLEPFSKEEEPMVQRMVTDATIIIRDHFSSELPQKES
ncbi:MAG: aminoacyl-tRNA hydrolase [bacterium]|nr:aminoacyl-tRNA hydrolase [bacterium]